VVHQPRCVREAIDSLSAAWILSEQHPFNYACRLLNESTQHPAMDLLSH
jgi:hypothetical protein